MRHTESTRSANEHPGVTRAGLSGPRAKENRSYSYTAQKDAAKGVKETPTVAMQTERSGFFEGFTQLARVSNN